MKRACLLWLFAAVAAQAAPKIEFDRTVYDFGATSLVESVTGTFTYRNTGDEVLKIQPPKPSCGCTVAKLTADTLKPGEKGELEFNIGLGFHAQMFNKEIYVASNDPQTPVVHLGLVVEVKQTFQAFPPSVSFGDVPLGATTNAFVVFKRLDGQKFTLTKVESSADVIHATVVPVKDSDGTSVKLNLELRSAGLPRRLSEQVRIHTTDSKGAAYSVFVAARIVGDVQLDPEALAWGMPDPEHWNEEDPDIILSRSVTITATRPGVYLELRNPSCALKDVSLKLEMLTKGRAYRLTASLPHRLTRGIQGSITLDTNLPSLPTLEIPLEVNIWRKD